MDYLEIPDKTFKWFLLANFDNDKDGRISSYDASRVVSLYIAGSIAPHIISLQGIEHFANLRELTVRNTNIRTLDVSRNKNLEHLDCADNRLEQLSLGRLNKLEQLFCEGNRLERLDISGLPSLVLLLCERNRLAELGLSHLSSKIDLIEAESQENLQGKLFHGNHTENKIQTIKTEQ